MLYVLACAYAAAGFLFWDIFVVKSGDGLSCPLVRCELMGGGSLAEDATFVTVKGGFVALWAPCLAFYTVARCYLRARGH